MVSQHRSVMAKEVIDLLRPAEGMVFVDATLGAGGHADLILERVGAKGRLIGIDWDEEALAAAQERLKGFGDSVSLVRENFINLATVLDKQGVGLVDGLLFDLGVSSLQLESSDRGFSFKNEGQLDMRMDRRRPRSAAHLVNRASLRELERLIREFGEERWARRIAQAICRRREESEIRTTQDLAQTVVSAIPAAFRHGPIHAATRTFQALRMAVHEELENLRRGIRAGVNILKPGGRMVVISFHSLEDGLVKREMGVLKKGCICPPGQALCTCGRVQTISPLTRKPMVPSPEEVNNNPRSRSAKLRAAERIS